MEWLRRAIDWIESHDHTVELIKWSILILVAWAAGLFRLIRATVQRLTRRPRLIINTETSRCYVETTERYTQKDESDHPIADYLNAMKVIYFLDVSALNPTLEKVTIRHFRLSYRTQRWEDAFKNWWRWKKRRYQIDCVNGNNQLNLIQERIDYADYPGTLRPTTQRL